MNKTELTLKAIGILVRRQRLQLAISQQRVADLAGTTNSTYSRFESGECNSLTLTMDICKALNLDFADIIKKASEAHVKYVEAVHVE